MAVSKRTRFEVLRRDDHTCRYCGQSAPDVKLTVDHVLPVALGGTDKPTNLVTSCRDCNAGKSSTAPDAALVAGAQDDAIRHAERTVQAYAVMVERLGEKSDYLDEFEESWCDRCLPSDWRTSIGRFHSMGVPIEVVVDAIQIAVDRTIGWERRFKYTCGVIWNQVEAVTEQVALRDKFDGCWLTEPALTDVRWLAYRHGHDVGYKEGLDRYRDADVYLELLSSVTDRAHLKGREAYESIIERHLESLRAVV